MKNKITIIFKIITLIIFICSIGYRVYLGFFYEKKIAYKKTEYIYTDIGYYFKTKYNGYIKTGLTLKALNLNNIVPEKFGDWNSKNIKTNDKNISFYRKYYKQNKNIYLIGVFGKNTEKFHLPEVCYLNAGWKSINRKIKKIIINDNVFFVKENITGKNGKFHILVYWYMFPQNKVTLQNGAVLLRITDIVHNEKMIPAALDKIYEFISNLLLYYNISRRQTNIKVDPSKITCFPEPKIYKYKRNYDKAKLWLNSMVVPNATIENPHPGRYGFIQSYQDNIKSYTYDNALCIIYFTLTKDYKKAEDIINSYMYNFKNSQKIYFAYNLTNSWPDSNDNYGAVERTGATSWLCYSIAYYLKHRLLQNPYIEKFDEHIEQYKLFLKKLEDYLDNYKVSANNQINSDLYLGGSNTYFYSIKNNQVEEKFKKTNITWCSAEHNIDMFFFLKEYNDLSFSPNRKNKIESLVEGLLRLWSEQDNQFYRGVTGNSIDTNLALDCASWGSIFLLQNYKLDLAEKSLDATELYKTYKDKNFYKPYFQGDIFENLNISKKFFKTQTYQYWNSIPLVWPEGGYGVGLAYAFHDKTDGLDNLLKEHFKLQKANGGILYSNVNIKFQFNKKESVASTVWFLLDCIYLNNPEYPHFFWKFYNLADIKLQQYYNILINTVALLFLITILFFVVLIIKRIKSAHYNKYKKKLKDKYSDLIMRYIYEDDSNILEEFKKPIDFKVFLMTVDSIIKLLKGESINRIIEISEKLKVYEYLLNEIQSKKWWIKVKAVYHIGQLKYVKAIDTIFKNLIKHKKYEIRAAIAIALYEIGDNKGIKILLKLLKDDNITVRIKAKESVIKFGQASYEYILARLNNKSVTDDNMIDYLDIMTKVKEYRFIDKLEKYFNSDNIEVIKAAINYSGSIEYPIPSDKLESFLLKADDSIKVVLLKNINSVADDSCISYITKTIKSKDWSVRYYSARALYAFGLKGKEELDKIIAESDDEYAVDMAQMVIDEQTNIN